MFKALRGPERLIRTGQGLIAILFAYFLLMLGSNLLEDLPSLQQQPSVDSYIDSQAVNQIKQQITPLQTDIEKLKATLTDKDQNRDSVLENYKDAKQSFDNWRATRSSTQLNEKNPEVINRTKKLDELLLQKKQLDDQINQLDKQKSQIEDHLAPLENQLSQLQEQANVRYEEAMRRHELKVFFFRLAFIAPLLLLSIWLFIRHRYSNQWPFIYGFIFFSLYAFFFELVPYLPSFGGYIRYGVGIVLTFFGGRALLRWLQRYLQKKQQEQTASQEQRKESLHYEQALASLVKQQCPSCDRKLVLLNNTLPTFCMHCGLQLIATCSQCHTQTNAFYHFCPECGHANDTSRQENN